MHDIHVSFNVVMYGNVLQDTNNSGAKSLLPPEGINAAANLFALIVESELKGMLEFCVTFFSKILCNLIFCE